MFWRDIACSWRDKSWRSWHISVSCILFCIVPFFLCLTVRYKNLNLLSRSHLIAKYHSWMSINERQIKQESCSMSLQMVDLSSKYVVSWIWVCYFNHINNWDFLLYRWREAVEQNEFIFILSLSEQFCFNMQYMSYILIYLVSGSTLFQP